MDLGQLEHPVPAGAYETLPARYCTDREIFAEETGKILARTWHLVGHRSQVSRKGDLLVAKVAGRELMIEQHARTTFPEDIPLVESVQRSMRSRSFDRGIVLVDRDRSQASGHGVKAFNDLYLRHMSEPDT